MRYFPTEAYEESKSRGVSGEPEFIFQELEPNTRFSEVIREKPPRTLDLLNGKLQTIEEDPNDFSFSSKR